jgi:hypothetical protein
VDPLVVTAVACDAVTDVVAVFVVTVDDAPKRKLVETYCAVDTVVTELLVVLVLVKVAAVFDPVVIAPVANVWREPAAPVAKVTGNILYVVAPAVVDDESV